MTSKILIPKYKIERVKELSQLLENKKTVLIVSIKNIPGSQFQEITKKLRGKAIVKVPKKTLIFRAIDSIKKEEFEEIKKKIKESFAILFSDMDAFDLASELLQNTSPTKAKAGQEAPEDISVEAGPTDLVPGPAISELGALGIQIQIEKGKISIKEPKVIAKKGEKISQNAADLMGKLDIKPFKVGFIPLCAFDSEENKFYSKINIDPEKILADLKKAYSKAIPFAIEINYLTQETIKLILAKAILQSNKLNRIITGEPEPKVVEPQESNTEKTEEKPQEEKKEAAAEGLSALFG